MKKIAHLILALTLVFMFSCKKDTVSDVEENSVPTDFRDKYVGNYNCLLSSRQTFYDGTNSPYTKDTSYLVTIGITKSESAKTLKVDNGSVSEITFDTEPNFSGARTQGNFFSQDCVYIYTSHPSGIYSYTYRGKKVN